MTEPVGDLSGEHLREECGVFGLYNTGGLDTAMLTYLALHALQHRGQESAGIAVSDGRTVSHYKAMGLVGEVFTPEVLRRFEGQKLAVGHVRYSTSGGKDVAVNAQPIVGHYLNGTIALAHNGTLINASALAEKLKFYGSVIQTDLDSEMIMHLIARYASLPLPNLLHECMKKLQGAYAVVMMNQNALAGFRDPLGIRPLVLGRIRDSYVLASESCALDAIGAQYVRDVAPGEVVIVDESGLHSYPAEQTRQGNVCVFEYVYLARPDSIIDGESVYQSRMRAGEMLAKLAPVEADVVGGVPDSALPSAAGYAKVTGIPYGDVLVKNRYVGRTFIQPTQELRELSVRLKLGVMRANVEGKRVVLIDDSIVRGTTSKRIVGLLRDAGAREVHLRIASPPVTHPCYFGIDTPTRENLISARLSTQELCRQLGADSLAFLTGEALRATVPNCRLGLCTACFDGRYPVPVEQQPVHIT